MTYKYAIGIDAGKEHFDAVLHGAGAKPSRFPNNSEGFARFRKEFAVQLPDALAVLEATGGYETALLAELLSLGTRVHRADPLTAKHFIRSLGKRAKTDKLDAQALARYGWERKDMLRLFQLGDKPQQELKTLLARRQDLLAMRVAEQTRLGHPRYQEVQACLRAVLKTLTAQIEAIEGRIETLIQASKDLSAKAELMTGFKGIGRKTAIVLLAHMPELGTLTRRQAASLAGCAPHPRDSGSLRGYRRTVGGRAAVKRALFMAAMCARRYNPTLSAFYARLVQNGKKPIVAIVAVMRKIVTILNAVLRDAVPQTTW
jgi:transposase